MHSHVFRRESETRLKDISVQYNSTTVTGPEIDFPLGISSSVYSQTVTVSAF